MEQESKSNFIMHSDNSAVKSGQYNNIAVIGAGASGAMCALLLSKNPYNKVTLFDLKEPFSTLLPTGGGRCNITNAQDDIREFVKNYPRGEKFLLSVFSRFDQKKTRKLLSDLGIETYIQEDNRVFPVSDSSAKTIKILSSHLNTPNVLFKKEAVISVKKDKDVFKLQTAQGQYEFSYVVAASGGKGIGFEIAKSLGHKVIEQRPSLCSLNIKENGFYSLAGVSFKDTEIKICRKNKRYPLCCGDFLFTHKSITGPCVFKVSALTAYLDFDINNPLEINVKVTNYTKEEIEEEIKLNRKKTIKNVFSKFAPESFIELVLKMNNIDGSKQAAQIRKNEKELMFSSLFELKLTAINRIKDSEIVTAGGVDLDEINPKTMESKIVKNLFFIGEVLNVDGFTGGYNLQNCWSGAYICADNINYQHKNLFI